MEFLPGQITQRINVLYDSRLTLTRHHSKLAVDRGWRVSSADWEWYSFNYTSIHDGAVGMLLWVNASNSLINNEIDSLSLIVKVIDLKCVCFITHYLSKKPLRISRLFFQNEFFPLFASFYRQKQVFSTFYRASRWKQAFAGKNSTLTSIISFSEHVNQYWWLVRSMETCCKNDQRLDNLKFILNFKIGPQKPKFYIFNVAQMSM